MCVAHGREKSTGPDQPGTPERTLKTAKVLGDTWTRSHNTDVQQQQVDVTQSGPQMLFVTGISNLEPSGKGGYNLSQVCM